MTFWFENVNPEHRHDVDVTPSVSWSEERDVKVCAHKHDFLATYTAYNNAGLRVVFPLGPLGASFLL